MNIYDLIGMLQLAAELPALNDWKAGITHAIDKIETELDLRNPAARLWYEAVPEMILADIMVKEIFDDNAIIVYGVTKTYDKTYIEGHIFTFGQNTPDDEYACLLMLENEMRERGCTNIIFTLGL